MQETTPNGDSKAKPATAGTRRGTMAIVGDGTRPLYKEVKLALTRLLSGGTVGAGEAIPTEKQLCEQYGVSIGTVRKAIDELVAERVLVRQQGRGTFLVSHTPERMLNDFWRIVRKDGVREIPIVQTLRFERSTADDVVAEALAIKPGDRVYAVTNIQILGGAPVVVDEILIAHSMFPRVTESGFRTRDTTVYGYYQDAFGVNVIKTFDKLSAVVASAVTAERLAVPKKTPVLLVERVAYTFDDRPVEFRRSYFLTQHYEYHNALRLSSD